MTTDEHKRLQKLDDQLNEVIEQQQSDSVAIKTDLQNVVNKMEYSHMDALRELKELVEQTHNRVFSAIIIINQNNPPVCSYNYSNNDLTQVPRMRHQRITHCHCILQMSWSKSLNWSCFYQVWHAI
jgi:hypothetical protein